MRHITSFLLLVILASVGFAQSIPTDKNAHVALVSEYKAAPKNASVYFGLHFKLREGWHIYWRNPGDAGLPPQIVWTQTPEGVNLGEFEWPLPKKLVVLENELMDYGYSKAVLLPFSVKLPSTNTGDTWVFEGEADYLICKDVCIPEVQLITLTLSVSDFPKPDLKANTDIQDALAKTPLPFEGEAILSQNDTILTLDIADPSLAQADSLRFFPFKHEIQHATKQQIQMGGEGIRLNLQKARMGVNIDSISGVLVTEADGVRNGIMVNASTGTPLTGFADAVLDGSRNTGGLEPSTPNGANTLSVARLLSILGLAFLGGVILNIMPCVLPVLAFKAFGMLSAANSGDHDKLRIHGLLYTIGVLVCFMGLALLTLSIRSAYGVASWGQWMQNPHIVAVLIFAIVFAGLWMFGAFNIGGSVQNIGQSLTQGGGARSAFFGGVLAASAGAPCVGPFLGVAIGALFTQPAWVLGAGFLVIGLGLASPFLVLSFVPAWTKYLPKPGAWMEYTKQALAFPMFLTAAWLSISLAALSGPGGVGIALAGIVGMCAAVWLLTLAPDRMLTKIAAIIVGAFSILAPLALLRDAPASEVARQTTSEAKQMAWSHENVQATLLDGKGVFIDFTATWCATCQVNKRTTLNTDAFRGLLDQNDIVFMVADFTRPNQDIATELQRHNRAGVPMYLYYAKDTKTPIMLPEVLNIALVRDIINAQ